MFERKLLRRGLVASVAAGGLLFAIAAPASATQVDAGAGAGTGWEVPLSDPNPCPTPPPANMIPPVDMIYPNVVGSIDGSDFDLRHIGTLVGFDDDGNRVAVYSGELDFHIEVGEHVISPAGTSPDCPVVGNPIFHPFPTSIESASVTGNSTLLSNTGSVNCNTLQGNPAGNNYIRVNNAVAFTLTLSCNITGNVPVAMQPNTVSGARTTFTVVGTMNICNLVPPLEDESPQNPECTELSAGGGPLNLPPEPAGGAGSHLVTTYIAAGEIPPDA